jgi:hypothetical protein
MDKKWDSYITAIKKKNPKFIEPLVPFRDDVRLCDFNNVYKTIYDREKYIS